MIHATAIVNPQARIGDKVTIGPYAVVEDDTVIGNETEIGSHAYIGSGVRIGAQCRIFNGASVGTIPQDLKFGGEKTTLEIGDGTTVREFCTLNRGTNASGSTSIGSGCLLMAYVHIAHDCHLGNNVIIANNMAMAGHVTIGSNVTIGGVCSIHQFVKVGDYSFIGANSYLTMDVAPFALTAGDPTRLMGINKVGLQRKGFSDDRRDAIKRAYKTLFRSSLSLVGAQQKLLENFPQNADIALIVDFIQNSQRGLMRI
ncbi:MAG: acyl-ACP--UDP-N-acetylglucosamine O-acyltransferase [Chitinivibrionales bacterium]|nr:acyl-ACP--UDP-N-acetylglucosamine O-acyltransferase [Chitinivibrionales bacterium]